MTEEYKLSVVVVDGKGKPVEQEFLEGLGNGVMYSCKSDIKMVDGEVSPLALADFHSHGREVLEDMVKIIIEKVVS